MDCHQRTVFTSLALLASFALGACSHIPRQTPYRGPVLVAQPDDVLNCQFLERLQGSSGLAGLFAIKGADNIRQHLLFEADAKGATHVVFDKHVALADHTSLSGNAYRCPAPKP